MNKVNSDNTYKDKAVLGGVSIVRNNDNTISISGAHYRSTTEGLKDLAKKAGMQIESKWNTQQLGKKLIDYVNAKQPQTIATNNETKTKGSEAKQTNNENHKTQNATNGSLKTEDKTEKKAEKKDKSKESAEKVDQSKNKKTDSQDKTKKRIVKVEHEFVDLGLPSGTLWAKYNIGAEENHRKGDFFKWGEVEPCEVYCSYNKRDGLWFIMPQKIEHRYLDTKGKCTKYNSSSDSGVVDNKTELEPIDDAATVQWGSLWRTPTVEEWKELFDNCRRTYYFQIGYCLTSRINGNYIFLPMRYYEDEENCRISMEIGQYLSTVENSIGRLSHKTFIRDHRKKDPEVSEELRVAYGSRESYPCFVRPVRK